MNYSADKLITIFGYTISDIVDINRKILRMHHVFEIPKLIANIMKYIPNDCFDSQFNLYPLWWAKTEHEFEKRYKVIDKAYKKFMSDIQAYIIKIGFYWIGECKIELEKKSYELIK
jgi:hypothetical protein